MLLFGCCWIFVCLFVWLEGWKVGRLVGCHCNVVVVVVFCDFFIFFGVGGGGFVCFCFNVFSFLFSVLFNRQQNVMLSFSSFDGVPFLLHDKTFRRTTNVAEVFPEMVDMDASLFNISQIKSLNAGSWFLEVRIDVKTTVLPFCV